MPLIKGGARLMLEYLKEHENAELTNKINEFFKYVDNY